MAKQAKGVGLTSKPPAKGSGKSQGNKGAGGKAPKQPKPPKAQNLPHLTTQQNQAINQQQDADLKLGAVANNQIGAIESGLSRPFDWSQVPQAPRPVDFSQFQRPNTPNWGGAPSAPVSGDFGQWRQEQINLANQDFDAQFGQQFKDQMSDFEQMAYERGWAPGSENYNREKTRLEKSQADQRRSNALAAMNQAGQNAQQFFNVGTTARANYMGEQAQQWNIGNQDYDNRFGDAMSQYGAQMGFRNDAIGQQQQQRQMPLNDYNLIRASVSGMPLQNLGYSQGMQIQDDAQAHDRWMMKNTPRGGGGGGGGAGPMWQQYGFGSPMEYDAYQDSRNRANQQWQFANDPRYRQPSGPSWGAQLAGGVLGGFAQGFGAGMAGGW